MHNKGKEIVTVDECAVSTESLECNSLPTYEDSDKPYFGQTFNDLDDVKQFYLSYGGRFGFSVRSHTTKFRLNKNTKERICCQKLFVCSKEGFYKKVDQYSNEESIVRRKRKITLTRVGCPAKLKVRLDMNNEKWVVVEFVEEHNHQLVSPSKLHYLPINRSISVAKRLELEGLQTASLRTFQQVNVLSQQSGGFNKMGCTERDIRNFQRDYREETKDYDAQFVIDHFKLQKDVDDNFFFAIDLDDNGRLKHCFWSDAISKQDFVIFGDAVTFDTTYRTNLYSLVFAVFCGVNHHWKTTTFGCALISDESQSTFEWIFAKFIECMGRAPPAIITDQDPAMNAAIMKVFPNTVHRFCAWHIMHKISDKLGGIATKFEAISEFNSLVYDSEFSEQFEERWSTWIEKNNMNNNKWLASIFSIKEKWVPIYMTDSFFAGMTTTQRSESLNAFIQSMVSHHSSLLEFVSRYEDCLKRQREKENICDFESKHKNANLCSGIAMEKQIHSLYTRRMFFFFQEQLNQSFMYNVYPSQANDPHAEEKDTFIVSRKGDDNNCRLVIAEKDRTKSRCSCRLFEFKGYPCRHLIAFLIYFKINVLPEHFILKRWFHSVKDGIRLDIYLNNNSLSKGSQYMEVIDLGKQIASRVVRGQEFYNYAKEQMKMMIDEMDKMQISAITENNDLLHYEPGKKTERRSITRSFSHDNRPSKELTILPPLHAKTKGSGRSGRPKGGGVPRIQSDREKRAQGRQCKACGKHNVSHDSRNCPDKNRSVGDEDQSISKA